MSASDPATQEPGTRAFVAAIAITTSGAMPAFLTGALGVQVKADLQISDTLLGAAVAALFASATLTTALGGRLADQLGWRRAVRLVAGCAILALGGIALLGGTYPRLVTFLLVGGLAFAMTTPTANLVLARTIPLARRGVAFGIQQSAVPLSTMLAGVAVPVVALTVGWRWAFAIAMALPLTAMLVVPGPAAAGPGRAGGDVRPAHFRTPPALVVLAIAGAIAALSIGALHGFVVVSAVRSGVAEATAGLLVAVSSVLAIGVRVSSGWLIDRVSADGFRRTSVMLAVGGLGYALLAPQTAFLAVPGTLLAYAAGWGWPGLFQYGITSTFPDTPASATGIIQTGFAGGTAIGPILFGFVADTSSYAWAWSGVAVACVVSAVLMDWSSSRLRTAVDARR